MASVLAGISLILWLFVGLFAPTESEFLSRRVRRTLPETSVLRWIVAPLFPGGSRGFLFMLSHLLALCLIVYVGAWPDWLNWVYAGALYVICFVGFGALVGRLAHAVTPEFRPAHARVLTVLIALFAMVAPYLVTALGLTRPTSTYSLMFISNPFSTLPVIADFGTSGLTDVILIMLGGVAALATILNLRAMLRGVFGVAPYRPPVS